MSERIGRRALWTGIAGIAIGVAGVVWDSVWHGRHPGIVGLDEVLQAHWLIFVGIVVVVGALSVAVAAVRRPHRAAMVTRIALASAVAMLAGFVWDSIYHARGSESSAAHTLIYLGLALVIVAIPAALVSLHTRRVAARSSDDRVPADDPPTA